MTPNNLHHEDSDKMKEIRARGEQGDAECQFIVAGAYWWGDSDQCDQNPDLRLPENKPLAVEWYLMSANNGYVPAQANIAKCYWFGWGGLKQDLKTATDWYLKAAKQGDAFSQFYVGYAYTHGIGGRRANVDRGKEWLIMAEKQGSKLATRELNGEHLSLDDTH